MEKINGKWIHDGREYEVVDGPCSDCHLYGTKQRFCDLLACKIGLHQIFKLKEPKMKKEELNFKVLTPNLSRVHRLKEAVEKSGIKFPKGIFEMLAICIIDGEVDFWKDPFCHFNSFDDCPAPEVTLEQALELLKRVEPVAPEFDIKLRDEVLVSDVDADIWELCEFARVHTDCFMMIGYGDGQKMIKYAGNEHLHGTTDTPDGWWECCEGKPIWRSK